MLALTLHRPMDWALVIPPDPHRKDVENRVWPAPSDVIGKHICIHSGQKWDAGYAAMVERLLGEAVKMPTEDAWPGGRIIGCVRVVDVVTPEDVHSYARRHGMLGGMMDGESDFDDYAISPSPWAVPGMCHWLTAKPIILENPVPHVGAQKLWRVTDLAEQRVREQVPSTTVFA
jgi:hypothetical protein